MVEEQDHGNTKAHLSASVNHMKDHGNAWKQYIHTQETKHAIKDLCPAIKNNEKGNFLHPSYSKNWSKLCHVDRVLEEMSNINRGTLSVSKIFFFFLEKYKSHMEDKFECRKAMHNPIALIPTFCTFIIFLLFYYLYILIIFLLLVAHLLPTFCTFIIFFPKQIYVFSHS